MLNSFLFSAAFFAAVFVYGQSFKKIMKEGNKLYHKEHFMNALPYFEKAYEMDNQSAEALYKKGVCWLNTVKKKEALEFILKAKEMNPNVSPHLDFWLGRAYHSNLMHELAIQHFKSYKETLKKRDSRNDDMDMYIHHCELAIKYESIPSDYFIKNLGENINSIHADHSPVISNDGNTLIFTSRREISTGGKTAPDGDFFEDIEKSTLLQDGSWSVTESIGSQLNTTGHDASVQLYDNDQKLLIYKYTKGGDFYTSDLENGKWTNPTRINELNTNYFESDAYITRDNKTIYFSSNRDSRDGNLDLYVSSRNDDGSWNVPERLKGKINSEYDEDSPYLSDDGNTLYFSYRGINSMGGYDIFKSEKQTDGTWGEPVDLGYPINSADDDTYYYMTEDGKTAYMASFRLGGYGEKDIYLIKKVPNVKIVGNIIDSVTQRKIPNLKVVLYSRVDSAVSGLDSIPALAEISDTITNDSLKTALINSQFEKIEGFDINVKSSRIYDIYVINDKNDTLFKDSVEVPLFEDEGGVLEKNFYIKYKWPVDSSKILTDSTKDSTTTVAQSGLEIKDIYFDFDKSNITNISNKELDNIAQIMNAYPDPELKLRITGHTDSKGSDAYNLLLSKRRAMAAYNYLISKGIDKSRLIVDYKGESQPIAPNTNSDGSDNPEGRAKNRRTELRWVEPK